MLYVRLAVPGELTVTERSVKAIPLPLDGGITQFPSPLRNVVASGVPLAPILAIVTAPASIAVVVTEFVASFPEFTAPVAIFAVEITPSSIVQVEPELDTVISPLSPSVIPVPEPLEPLPLYETPMIPVVKV